MTYDTIETLHQIKYLQPFYNFIIFQFYYDIWWALLVWYFIILFKSNAISTIFSQQILSGKLLLVFNWDNHFKLCIKKNNKQKTNKRKLCLKQWIFAHQIWLNQNRSLGTQQNVTIFS